jgi:hypothetical protein
MPKQRNSPGIEPIPIKLIVNENHLISQEELHQLSITRAEA